MKIDSKEEFGKLVNVVECKNGYRKPIMFGICRDVIGRTGSVLESKFIVSNHMDNYGSSAVMFDAVTTAGCDIKHITSNEVVTDLTLEAVDDLLESYQPYVDGGSIAKKHTNIIAVSAIKYAMESYNQLPDEHKQSLGEQHYRVVFIYEDTVVETVEAAYLKLTILSEGQAPIRSLNLDGVFGVLTTCAWLANGTPVELDLLREEKPFLVATGQYPEISYIDKFPRMLQHVIPKDSIRILDTSKVRMGAQLADGTTVMPGASYINFNAGTTGACMVEGRISSSAVVGAGSDVGGGASILGVLSGTDGNPISVGKQCLLGANSVCGIPLGDGCIIDAGLSILAGTKLRIHKTDYVGISLVNDNMPDIDDLLNGDIIDDMLECNASSLSGLNGIHYRQDSLTGVTVAMRSVREVKLNKDLH